MSPHPTSEGTVTCFYVSFGRSRGLRSRRWKPCRPHPIVRNPKALRPQVCPCTNKYLLKRDFGAQVYSNEVLGIPRGQCPKSSHENGIEAQDALEALRGETFEVSLGCRGGGSLGFRVF